MKQQIQELIEKLQEMRKESYRKANFANESKILTEEYLESGRAYGLETAISNLKKLLDIEDEPNTRIVFTGDVCVVKQGSNHPYVELNGPDASLAELYNDLVEANESIEEDGDSGFDYFEDCEPNISDADFDSQALASAGHGTDEDYGCYRDDY